MGFSTKEMRFQLILEMVSARIQDGGNSCTVSPPSRLRWDLGFNTEYDFRMSWYETGLGLLNLDEAGFRSGWGKEQKVSKQQRLAVCMISLLLKL